MDHGHPKRTTLHSVKGLLLYSSAQGRLSRGQQPVQAVNTPVSGQHKPHLPLLLFYAQRKEKREENVSLTQFKSRIKLLSSGIM